MANAPSPPCSSNASSPKAISVVEVESPSPRKRAELSKLIDCKFLTFFGSSGVVCEVKERDTTSSVRSDEPDKILSYSARMMRLPRSVDKFIIFYDESNMRSEETFTVSDIRRRFKNGDIFFPGLVTYQKLKALITP